MRDERTLDLPEEMAGSGQFAGLPPLNRCGPRTTKQLLAYATMIGIAAAEGKLTADPKRVYKESDPFVELVSVGRSSGFIGVCASADWLEKHLHADA